MPYRLDTLYVLNWGVYDGPHEIHMTPSSDDHERCAVCLTGDTGSGKTTIGDAYLSIIKPRNADSSYNAASNGGVGAHRERRTTVSYVRGDLGKDASDGDAERRLRPQDVVNSGIIGKFVSTDDDEVWCGRLMQYFSGDAKLRQVWVVSTEPIDLEKLNDEIGTAELDTRLLSRLLPEKANTFGNVGGYELSMGSKLGLGHDSRAIGNVTKLLELVQNEKTPSDIDALFKTYVLEDVDVRGRIRRCLETMDSENERIREMELTRVHIERLRKLGEEYETFDERCRKEVGLNQLAGTDTSTGLLAPWSLALRSAAAGMEVRHFEEEIESQEAELATLRQEVDDAYEAAENARMAYAQSQTDAERQAMMLVESRRSEEERAAAELGQTKASLASCDADIRLEKSLAEQAHDKANSTRTTLTQKTTLLDAAVASAKEFEPSIKRPTDALSWDDMVRTVENWDKDAEAKARKDQDELVYERGTTQKQAQQLEKEITERETRKTRLPSYMVNMRDELAAAMNVSPKMLPYVAELADMAEGQERWRTAANAAFGGLSRKLFVDKDDLRELQRVASRIGNKYHQRVQYQVINLDLEGRGKPLDDGIVSKMVFDESSDFAAAASRMLSRFDHHCVEDIRSAPRDTRDRYVALDGQTFSGSNGAFGKNKDNDLIGFENATQLEDMRSELEDLRNDILRLSQEISAKNKIVKRFEKRADTASKLRSVSWKSMDVTEEETIIKECEHTAKEHEAKARDAERRHQTLEQELDARNAALKAAKNATQDALAALDDIRDSENEELKERMELLLDKHRSKLKALGVAEAELESIQESLLTAQAHLDETAGAEGIALPEEAQRTLCEITASDRTTWVLDENLDIDDWSSLYDNVCRNMQSLRTFVRNDKNGAAEHVEECIRHYADAETALAYGDGSCNRQDWLYGSLSGNAWAEARAKANELGLENVNDSDPRGHIRLSWLTRYADELQHLETEWGALDLPSAVRALVSTSLNSLASLHAADGTIQRNVRKRMTDVNAILEDIPLSGDDPTKHHLSVRHTVSRDREADATFAKLREFAQLNTKLTSTDVDFDELRDELVAFADELRNEAEPKGHCFLDPRQYVKISFIEHKGDKQTTHAGTGRLSGGEMQQISACVVGAALLYVMEADPRHGPTYRTLILDEAFVKSDAAHAKSTLAVLMRMGFLPIVAMPPTMVMSVSECLSRMLFVTKSDRGSSDVHESKLAENLALTEGDAA